MFHTCPFGWILRAVPVFFNQFQDYGLFKTMIYSRLWFVQQIKRKKKKKSILIQVLKYFITIFHFVICSLIEAIHYFVWKMFSGAYVHLLQLLLFHKCCMWFYGTVKKKQTNKQDILKVLVQHICKLTNHRTVLFVTGNSN